MAPKKVAMEKAVSLFGLREMEADLKTTVTVMDILTQFTQLQSRLHLKTRTFHGTQSTASPPAHPEQNFLQHHYDYCLL